MKKIIAVVSVPVLLLCAVVFAADIKLEGVNCVVASSKAAKADKSVDYKGAKLFFCCEGCASAFSKDTAKFAAQANHQLVATGRAKQEKCPFSGRPCSADKTVEVAGVKVAFCCAGCQGKVAAAKGAEQLELCFSNKAFDGNFKVGK